MNILCHDSTELNKLLTYLLDFTGFFKSLL